MYWVSQVNIFVIFLDNSNFCLKAWGGPTVQIHPKHFDGVDQNFPTSFWNLVGDKQHSNISMFFKFARVPNTTRNLISHQGRIFRHMLIYVSFIHVFLINHLLIHLEISCKLLYFSSIHLFRGERTRILPYVVRKYTI